MSAPGFVPPPYPYDRLASMLARAEAHEGGAVDLSIGNPTDPPPPMVLEAMAAAAGSVAGYPPSIGTKAFREAAAEWLYRRLGADVPVTGVGACVGTKEFVASVPHYLRLRRPDLDTVLYPALSYPTYAMGATLAGCRAVPVPVDEHWRLDLSVIAEEDAARALLLWVNSPGNPAGQLEDLRAVAAWGRAHGVPVFSDECYVEFTWAGRGDTILQGSDVDGLVAVHSLSKRSNMAGLRVGFYAGDGDLVDYLKEVRKHAGNMVPGPVQAAAIAALADFGHVIDQRVRYHERLQLFTRILGLRTHDTPMPAGGFYLWAKVPDGDAWAFAEMLATEGGVLVTPGDTFGPQGAGYVRVAMVQPEERLRLVVPRLRAAEKAGRASS
ncbi:MAG TPA: pyridoxal phosphate-dependent aminotransferase [Acidimicrobiales bacterium]|nr:pyridoxal phosphate-dependent aminotransferase [Acidimicrobiales bacterium]